MFRLDANTCSGMLLRAGARELKHLSTTQFCRQCAIQPGIHVQIVYLQEDVSDMVTDRVGERERADDIERAKQHTPGELPGPPYIPVIGGQSTAPLGSVVGRGGQSRCGAPGKSSR